MSLELSPREKWGRLSEKKLGHGAPDSSGSSISSGRSGERGSPIQGLQTGAFSDVARFWRGAESAHVAASSIVNPRVVNPRPSIELREVGTSISTLSASAEGSANGGSDFDGAGSFNGSRRRPSSPTETDIAGWARDAHQDRLNASEEECQSTYSYASAIDLAAVAKELGLGGEDGGPPEIENSEDRSSEVTDKSPPLPPERSAIQELVIVGSEIEYDDLHVKKDVSALTLEDILLECPKFSAETSASVALTHEVTYKEVDDTSVDIEEDNLGAEGKHVYGGLGRQCSFAESFARRKAVGLRASRARRSPGTRDDAGSNNGRGRHTKNASSSRSRATRPAKMLDASSMIDRAAQALAELLDQKRTAANRLTEGTRSFSSVFTVDEKDVFGVVVKAALALIRQRTSSKETNKYSKDASKFQLKTHEGGGGQLVVRRQSTRAKAVKGKRKTTAAVPDVLVTQRILLGSVTKPKTTTRGSGSRGTPAAAVMLITDGTVLGMAESDATEASSLLPMSPRGPLVRNASNESIYIQLPFAATLISILAVLARLDCELIFKRRKNRGGDHRSNSQSDKDAATVHARAKQDRSSRHFAFSVVVQGASPARITFRRPKFIAMRRVDDYVDIVLDSKELIAEYCSTIWGRVPNDGS